MPDRRKHRGPHPEDEKLFRAESWPALRQATADFSLLLTRGYSSHAALKLVGDHFQLAERQRLAVLRSSCSDQSLMRRMAHRISVSDLPNRDLAMDGFNVLTTVEAALSGGILLQGRDGCLRDMASMHGNYREVQETEQAIKLIGEVLDELRSPSALWLLDKPVSNSGRLSQTLRRIASEEGWEWSEELVANPDHVLVGSEAVVCSSDSMILDACPCWFNLAAEVVGMRIPSARVVCLG